MMVETRAGKSEGPDKPEETPQHPAVLTVAEAPATDANGEDSAGRRYGTAKAFTIGTVLVLGGLGWAGLRYCGTKPTQTAQVKKPAAARPGDTPAAPLTQDQLASLTQPTPGVASPRPDASPTPGLSRVSGTVAGSNYADLTGDNIFQAQPQPNGGAGLPVTQTGPKPASITLGTGAGDSVAPIGNISNVSTQTRGGPGLKDTVGTIDSGNRDLPGGGLSGSAGQSNRSLNEEHRPTPEEFPNSSPATQKSYFLFADETRTSSANNAPTDSRPAVTVRQGNNSGGVRRPLDYPDEVSLRRETPAQPQPARPPFGTVLPLQTLGAVDTLRSGSLVRMTVTRTVTGRDWQIPRGTIFVGRVAGDAGSRALVQILGYVDNQAHGFVRLGGELFGADGAGGLAGRRKNLSSRWVRAINYFGERAYTSFNTWLSSRNGGNATSIQLPSSGETGLINKPGHVAYVLVPTGSFAYFTVTELPPETETAPATLPPWPDEASASGSSGTGGRFSDDDVADLLATGDDTKVRAALPRMKPETRRLVENLLNQKP